MKKKTLLIIITIFLLFCFVVLLKGLSNSNTYVPDTKIGKQLLSFKAKKLFNKYNWPTVDVTRKSVEETAASIIKIYEIAKENG